MARFLIADPQQRIQIFEISRPTIAIGRVESNDLVLDHGSVSRQHARVSILPGGGALLTDLGSLNGTYVNGRQVKEHRLADQDRVSIGVYELKYEVPEEPPLQVEAGPQVPFEIPDLLARKDLGTVVAHRPRAEPHRRAAEPAAPALSERVHELERETQQLRLLLAVGKTLASVLLPEEIMRRVMDLVFQMRNVERGFVMLPDERGGFKPAVILYKSELSKSHSPHADPSTVVLSKKLIERVRHERLPLLIRNVAEDERFADSESLKLSGVRSAMCAPLIYKDDFLGIFYVDSLSKAMAFSGEELGVFAAIAAQAAMSLDNARSHEELSRHALERQALQRFLSPAVVTRILSNPEQIHLGGETQAATILFADVRNFTRMAESMEPQQIVELLNEFFSEMTEVIFDNGGTLDKYLGDGLMALFGAPIARADDPVRAVRAAIEMKRVLARAKRHWQVLDGREFRIGIGINTGRVTAGNIGSTQRMDYTAIGDTVNVAARLCAGAAGGQIVVSDATFRELHGSFPTRKRHAMRVKGRESPLEVYEILWESTEGA
jgi:adenylate cyclase